MKSFCIRSAAVHTVTHGTLEETDVLVRGGKIVAIGSGLPVEPDCESIAAKGLHVYPGLIDTHTHLGLDEWGNWDEINELNEMGEPITPQLRAVDGLFWADRAFAEAARAGVTSIIVHPGSIQLFSGQSCAVKTRPGALKEKCVDACIGIKGGFGGTPKRFYGALRGYPATRMGEAYALRKALADASDYLERETLPPGMNWEEGEKLRALWPLLRREIPWRVHVYKLYDIMTCLRIAEEFHLRVVLEHGGESPEIAPYLAEHGVYVTVGPSGFIGSVKPETFYSVLDNVGKLVKANVVFGFQSDHPIIHTASLPRAVGILVKKGLDADRALAAMTIQAAKIIGCDARLGSIDVGKDADLFISDGSPFDPTAIIRDVFIDGERVAGGQSA